MKRTQKRFSIKKKIQKRYSIKRIIPCESEDERIRKLFLQKRQKAKWDEEEEKKEKQMKERMENNGLNELASIWVWDNIDGNTDNSLNLSFI